MDYPFDAAVLARLARAGLDETEATDFIKKHQAYLGSLSPAQYEAVKNTLPSWEEAAKSIDPNMTAADLQNFVARRGQTPPSGALAICFPIPLPPHPHLGKE